MLDSDRELETLSEFASSQDKAAIEQQLTRYRVRLRRMIAARLDPRLASRIDASDVVQETLAKAVQKLPEYLREQPLPVYPWLRQLALQRISNLRQAHLEAHRRTVLREEAWDAGLSDNSVTAIAERFFSRHASPSQLAMKRELHEQVRAALDRLPHVDREVLVMRFVEQLTVQETASILGITPDAVRMRRLRALRKLSEELERKQG